VTQSEDLAHFLVGAGGSPPGPDAEAARRFVAEGVLPGTLSQVVAEALVDLLVAERELSKLTLLCEKGARDVAKVARRGLHRLRSHGVRVDVPRPELGTLPSPVPVTEPGEAWTTTPDAKGARLVAVLVPGARAGFCMIHVQVSDELGLVDVFLSEGPKRAWRDLRRAFREEMPDMVMADLPIGYAVSLIEEAYELTVASGRSPPSEFAHARSFLPPSSRGEHPALSRIAPAALSAGDAEALFELSDLAEWAPAREHLTSLSLRMEEVATSTLLIDERQRRDARRAVIDRIVEKVWDTPSRERYRRRLLDCALIYGLAGHEDDAGRLRAQADRLASPEFVAVEDPFARRLVEKLLPEDLQDHRIVSAADSATEAPAAKKTLWTP
jgi:hypothetical protein